MEVISNISNRIDNDPYGNVMLHGHCLRKMEMVLH